MAANLVEIVLKAYDQASGPLNRTAQGMGRVAASGRQLTATQASVDGLSRSLQALGPVSMNAAALGQSLALGPAVAGLAALALALTGAAVAAKGLISEMKRLGAEGEKIQNIAAVTGLAASQVQGLRKAFEDAGISAESLTVGVRFLNRHIAENDQTLKSVGVTTRKTGEALFRLSDIFAAMPDGPEKTSLAIAELGRAGSELVPVMNRGGDALRAMVAQSIATGTSLKDDLIPVLAEVDNRFDSIKRSIEGMKNTILVGIVPAFAPLIEKVDNFIKQLLILPNVIELAAARLDKLFPGGNQEKETERLKNAIAALAEQMRDLFGAPTGPTILDMMRDQGMLTLDMLRALSRQSDEFLKGIGTSAAAVKGAIAAMELGMGKATTSASVLSRMVNDATTRTTMTLNRLLSTILLVDGAMEPLLREKPATDLRSMLPKSEDLERLKDDIIAVEEATRKWLASFELMPSIARTLDGLREKLKPGYLFEELSGNILGSMEQELSQSLGNMLRGTQSFKSAMTNLWRAIKDAIVQQIAVIIARILMLMVVLPVLTAIFTAIFGPGAAPIVRAAFGLAPRSSGGTREPIQGEQGIRGAGFGANITNITNVYAYDARNAIAEIMSPSGMLRRANERVAIVRAY